MSPDEIAPMVIVLASLATFTIVRLFRPITQRLGSVLEAIAIEKRERAKGPKTDELSLGLDAIQRRLDRIDYRLECIERGQEGLPARTKTRQIGNNESTELTALRSEVNALLGRTGDA